MISNWTNADIEAILLQLNDRLLPFDKYEFSNLGSGLVKLGSGGSSIVYEAHGRANQRQKCAIKVIGFGNGYVNSDTFRASVDAQRSISSGLYDAVNIWTSVELRVWIVGEHEVSKVELIDNNSDLTRTAGNYLHLQFIVMEKIMPIIESDASGQRLLTGKLATYDEKEIIKLAYQVGMSLERAHSSNIIHRDIKLENIFYDSRYKQYKLGDFGIARTTDTGFASTVAFSKGYGAPEVVGTLEDSYDYTADIYSLGMTIYLLLNELRFPDSESYIPNSHQYTTGYEPPRPVNGSDVFIKIVLKMISYSPDDRYQSMEEVLCELDKIKFNNRVKVEMEHRNAPLAMGAAFALVGTAVWKLSFDVSINPMLTVFAYVMCTLVLLSCCFSGLSATKLIWGIIFSCIIVFDITGNIMTANDLRVEQYTDIRWIAVLLLILAVGLLMAYALLKYRNDLVTGMYFKKNGLLLVGFLVFTLLLLSAICVWVASDSIAAIIDKLVGSQRVAWFMSWNPERVGACGIIFCVIWILREVYYEVLYK